MATIRREIRIAASADDIWKVVGRPDLLHHWFPGMSDCTVQTVDGVTTRTIVVGAGIPMPEEILINDPIQRRFQYRLTVPAFEFHRGTIDVIELAPDDTLVVYSTDCIPNAMALVIGGATGGALDELKAQFDAGEGPALDAAGLHTTSQGA
ncbi:MAG TPA: SRPBCC family protein [Microthrixaceae bacterium]|nr:SRPBCC family protein [Microthrixaceae bacterium]